MAKIQPKEYKRQITILKNKVDEYRQREDFSKAISMDSIINLKNFKITTNPRLKEQVIPITILSDGHFEEPVPKSVVNGLNEYNLDIAKYRVETYFKRLLYMIRQCRQAGYKMDTLVFGLLGDFISGYIHEELEESNVLTPVQAALFAQDLLIKGIKTLSEDAEMKKIIIPCITGNHGRTTRRIRFISGYKNSYEYLMYHEIAKMFDLIPGYDNLEFQIADGDFIYLDLFGYLNLMSHGHQFRYQGGIGGIEVPLKKYILRENSVASANPAFNDRGIDMVWMGHWHQYISMDKARINGSVIGYNSFARVHGFNPEPPKMQFQLLDKKRGYTLNNPIILTDF